MTTFQIITQGCAQNQSDSEQMAGLLKEAEFVPAEKVEDADIVIFNTCTVKTPVEDAFFDHLHEFRKEHPYKIIIVAGCIAQTNPDKLKEYPLIGTKQIQNVVEVVEEALNNNHLRLLDRTVVPPLDLPRLRENPFIEIITISQGCLGNCTFCKAKHARGNLVSYPVEEIVKEAVKALKEGVQQIWLTSQDTFCYGFDLGTNLPSLLNELVKLPYEFKIQMGMGNPDNFLKIEEEMLKIMAHPKIYKFLHLPLQAGHNFTLKSMGRKYTVQKYIGLIERIREPFPELNLMTDIIVGFPDETDDHFWGTLQAVRRISPDLVNISRFWSRSGTKAAEMKQLDVEVIQHRSKVLTDIFQNISKLQNERWKGWEGKIVIDEKDKEDGQWIGHNFAYKPIVMEGNFKQGDVVKVKVVRAETFCLKGEILN